MCRFNFLLEEKKEVSNNLTINSKALNTIVPIQKEGMSKFFSFKLRFRRIARRFTANHFIIYKISDIIQW